MARGGECGFRRYLGRITFRCSGRREVFVRWRDEFPGINFGDGIVAPPLQQDNLSGIERRRALTACAVFLGAVTIVTAGMASQLLPLELTTTQWSAALLVGAGVLLASGKFKALEGLMKVLMIVLTVSTLIAIGMASTFAIIPIVAFIR